jgi:nicotinamidase-related amidase
MALLVIDMQKDGMPMVPAGWQILPVVRRVLDACRAKNIPVLFKKRVHRADGIDVERFRRELFARTPFLVEGTPGAEVVEELLPLKGECQIQGARFSGFFQTDLQLLLTRMGVRTLVICGMQTPNCIRATVTDALAYDYDVLVLRDATAAQTPAIHEANLFDMKNMGTKIVTSEEFLLSLG